MNEQKNTIKLKDKNNYLKLGINLVVDLGISAAGEYLGKMCYDASKPFLEKKVYPKIKKQKEKLLKGGFLWFQIYQNN